MVHNKKQILITALKIVLNLVGQLFGKVRFTRHNMAGNNHSNEASTNKTSVTISGEYRKEETRNGNSRRT